MIFRILTLIVFTKSPESVFEMDLHVQLPTLLSHNLGHISKTIHCYHQEEFFFHHQEKTVVTSKKKIDITIKKSSKSRTPEPSSILFTIS